MSFFGSEKGAETRKEVSYEEILLWRILDTIREIKAQGEKILKEIDDLNTAVTTIGNAINVAVTDIQTIVAELNAAKADPVAIETAAQKLEALATTLKAATDAAIPPEPVPGA